MTKDILFIGDPWATLDHDRDSTLHLARVAKKAFGLRSFWALPENIFFQNGSMQARVDGEINDTELITLSDVREFRSFQSVHWRADPPVTLSTMRLWSLLAASGGEKGVPFVNSPHALLTWNEKFAPLRFREWAIPSVVSDSERVWKIFFEESTRRGQQIVVKPSGDAASRGVQILPDQWESSLKILRELQATSGSWLVLQEYDKSLLELGETRVFILGPHLKGAINKRPNPKHKIMNLDVPVDERPTLAIATLTTEQSSRAHHIAKALASEGVYLATIDFIGSKILEINVTSPGLISWLDEKSSPENQIASQYWEGLLKS